MMESILNPTVQENQKAWQQQQQGYSCVEDDEWFGSGHGWPSISSTHYGTNEMVDTRSTLRIAKDQSKATKKRRSVADKSPMGEGEGQVAKRYGTEQREASGEGPKEEEEEKMDYIHVRARRGQATDSHSLAERVRRERISVRMKYLQDLVPGCDKVTGKAGMLDEIINYVQSLQKQVEFLSMKVATANPGPEFNIESLFNEEINLAGESTMPMFGMSSNLIDPSYLQSNLSQQVTNCGYDMAMNSSELALRRTMSTPMSSSETFSDSCFSVPRPSSGLDNEVHSLYGLEFQQGRGPTFPFQSLQGNLLPNNLKMEM